MRAQERHRWDVLLAQSGDREALDVVLKELQGSLFGFLVGLIGPDRAPDALQETLICICRGLPRLRDPDLLQTWSFRIAAREAFRRIKADRHGVRRWADPSHLESIPDEAEVSHEFEWAERLPGLLGEVPPASRAVLMLHHLQGMSLREVGDVLGVNLGTVKSRLGYGHRCLSQLAEREGFR